MSNDILKPVLVGVITDAHGIKGEVKLKSFTTVPTAIKALSPVQTKAGATFTILTLRPQKDDFIATLSGITDRNQAEALRHTELFVARDRLPKLKPHETYAHDLLGNPVLLPDGTKLGTLIAMPNYGAGDLLEVERDGQSDTILIPFTSAFVPQDDFSTGSITVVLPEGYLDNTAKDEP